MIQFYGRLKNKKIIVISSIDAKVIAWAEGIQEIIWLRILSTQVYSVIPDPILLFCNNQIMLKLTCNLVCHNKSKAMELWLYYIWENILLRIIYSFYISTTDQITNILTKSLSKQRFIKLYKEMEIENLTLLKRN